MYFTLLIMRVLFNVVFVCVCSLSFASVCRFGIVILSVLMPVLLRYSQNRVVLCMRGKHRPPIYTHNESTITAASIVQCSYFGTMQALDLSCLCGCVSFPRRMLFACLFSLE